MEKVIAKYKEITDWYGTSIFDNLEFEAGKLQVLFEKIIQGNSLSHELVSSNSIHSSYYFSVKKRVKSSNSLLEKFVRKNIGLDLSEKIEIDGDDFISNKSIVEKYIKKEVDDIIGLRVVCDLKEDCHKVLKLIKDKESEFKDNKVVFNLGELDNQPQKMRNGLDIYRFKGCYDDRISFELQIKSKIEEAWGELDHFMIYKDYSFFPSKDTVQGTMNNVGHLLDRIELLLYDLRSTRVEYNKGLERNKFLSDLESLFSQKLKDIFGFEYPLQGLSDVLYSIVDLTEINKDDISSFNLNFSTGEHKDEEVNDFIFSRNKSFELKLIEKIYLLSVSDNTSNYCSNILCLIGELKERINSDIIKNKVLFEQDFDQFYKNYYNLFVTSKANESLWISPRSIIDALNDIKIINILLDDLSEEIDDDSEKQEAIEFLKIIVASFNFGCDIKILLKKLLLTDSNQLKLLAISLKGRLNNFQNQYIEEKQSSKLKLRLNLISSEL
jgi:ppGpp synthetase/RelA/SpoT-type nucleotidyltranferase